MSNTIYGKGDDPILGQSFGLDLQNAVIGYFKQCSGFSSENAVIVDQSVDSTGRRRTRKIPGPIAVSNITLSRGITGDTSVWEWIKKIAETGIEGNRRDGTITLYDVNLQAVAKWEIVAAWPVRVSGPSMNADGGQVGLEEIELAIESFRRVS